MPSREQKSDLSFAQTIEPQALAATKDGAGVDLQGFDSATIEVRYGNTVNAGTTFIIEVSDDDVTYVALTAGQIAARPDLNVVLLGDAIPAAAVANASYKAAYVGQSRYIRVAFDAVGGPTDASAVVVRGTPDLAAV